MKKIFLSICLATALLYGCDPVDVLNRYQDTHIVLDDADMSLVPGVLVERPQDDIILEFDQEVDKDILKLLRLTDYTEKMPAILPESLPGVKFDLDPDDESQVIVDVSLLDCTAPKPVTLIYYNDNEPVLAHMMLVEDSSDEDVFDGEKSSCAVISDLHLNDARSLDKGWAWCVENQNSLLAFLDKLIEENDRYRELVLLGDIIDEYVTPVPYAAFAKPDGTVVDEKEYFRLIAEANDEVFDKLKELQAAGVRLIYVPGNHDCGLDAEDVHDLLGPDAVYVSDARGLGAYVPEYASEIVMEHSHRFDVMCSPDMLSNIGIDNVTEENAFLGAQYFVTRVAATHDYLAKQPKDNIGSHSLADFGLTEDDVRRVSGGEASVVGSSDDFNLFLTKAVWNVVGLAKDFPGIDTVAISTGVSGLTDSYVASRYSYMGIDPKPDLYKTMYLQSEWEKRLECNKAPSGFPFLLGAILCEVPFMDEHAVSWVAERDTKHRIFVWAHTHNPLLMTEMTDSRDRGYIYANTGSWVDDGVSRYDTRSFVDLYFGKDGYIQVRLGQLDEDESVKTLDTPLWLKR